MNSDNTRRFRVGLIGAGHICPFHIQALQRLESVQIEGIFDCDQQRAEQIAASFELPRVFESADELFRQVDTVHVLTPPDAHADLAIDAMKHGCDVFVEKPLAASIDDFDRIIEAANKYDCTVGVDHSLLLDPFTQQARRLIADGKIGEVQSVECLRSQDRPPYEGGPMPDVFRDGGNPFRDLGIHSLYQIEAYLGAIRDVKWMFERLGNDSLLHFDEWQAMIQCDRGSAHLRISWNSRPLQDLILIHGTEGTIKLDRFGMAVTLKRQGRLPEHPRRAANALKDGVHTAVQVPVNMAKIVTGRIRRYHGLQAMVENFYQSLQQGVPPLAGPADAKRVGYWLEQVATDADEQKRLAQVSCDTSLAATTLVTGATGFIGGHLLNRLLRDGRRVRIFCRRPPSANIANHPQVEVMIGDLGDPEAVDRAVAGTEVVYHIAGVIHGAADEFKRGSVAGTTNIVNSTLKHGVKQLIYISSLSVLHSLHADKRPIDEDWPLEPQPEKRGLYTQTKLAAEQVVTRAVVRNNLPAVIVRPGEVIGQGAPLLSSGVGQRKGNWLIVFGDGKLEVPLINVEDLVDALITAEGRSITDGSIIHLVDPNTSTQNQLADAYCEMTGQSLKRIYIPRLAIYSLALAVQAMLTLLRRSSPVSVYRFRSALARRRYTIEKSRLLLGWHARGGIADGLQATVRGVAPITVIGTEAETAPKALSV